jgi:hypothetical protein
VPPRRLVALAAAVLVVFAVADSVAVTMNSPGVSPERICVMVSFERPVVIVTFFIFTSLAGTVSEREVIAVVKLMPLVVDIELLANAPPPNPPYAEVEDAVRVRCVPVLLAPAAPYFAIVELALRSVATSTYEEFPEVLIAALGTWIAFVDDAVVITASAVIPGFISLFC